MKQESEGHHRHSKKGYVHGESKRCDPRREGGTDVRSHNHTYGIAEGKKSCIHKAYHHDGSRRRRLHKSRNHCSGKYPFEGVGSHLCHEGPESVTCRFLETFAHKCHSVEEHRQSSKYRKHIQNSCHIDFNIV